MKTATVRQLRNDYAKLLRRVESGEEITISRRGRVVAKLVPAISRGGKVDWSTSQMFKALSKNKPLSAEESRNLIHDAQSNW